MKVMFRDLNVKIRNKDMCTRITGCKSRHVESNENRRLILGFTKQNDMRK